MSNNILLDSLDRIDTLSDSDERVVVEAFMERYDVRYEEALDIFNETKKWLWLASRSIDKQRNSLFIDKSLLIIDEMWHNFILHTRLYYNFCLSNFNRIIHHEPTPYKEKLRYRNDYSLNSDTFEKKRKEETSKQLSFIYDELGPQTLLKWYDTLADKYTPDYIKSIEKM